MPSFTIEKHFWQSPKSTTNQPFCLVVKMTAATGDYPEKNDVTLKHPGFSGRCPVTPVETTGISGSL